MTRLLALLAALALFTGCFKAPVSTTHTDNPEIKVELLFEHDGIKVYRFKDGGNHRYYTDARGSTMWTEKAGKASRPMAIENNH